MRIRSYDEEIEYDNENGIDSSLINTLFDFILELQQGAIQLKMNHWLTTEYAEHKSNDSFVKILHKYADAIAETSMGEFQRPKIEAKHLNVNDISTTSTRWALDTIREKTNTIINALKGTDHEGILSIITEFDAEFKKAIYLSTLK